MARESHVKVNQANNLVVTPDEERVVLPSNILKSYPIIIESEQSKKCNQVGETNKSGAELMSKEACLR